MLIGLKSSWRKKQLLTRLKASPPLVELYLADGDLENEKKLICESLAFLSSLNIVTTLHQPHYYKNLPLGIAYEDKKIVNNCIDCWNLMSDICDKFSLLGFIAHPYMFLKHTEKIDCKETLLENLLLTKQYWKYLFLENDGEAYFANIEDIQWIASRTSESLRFCLDIAHFYMVHRNNYSKKRNTFFKERIKYLHISDSDGKVDGLEIGAGYIDFSILKYFKDIPGIIEVRSKNEENPLELITSWKKMQSFIKVTNDKK